MKSATTLLLLGAAASCQAFVTTPSTSQTTALSGYHYTNGAEPDPSSTASKPDPNKGLKPVFPAYTRPDPKPAADDDASDKSKKKGLNRVFLDWEDRGFSADGLQNPSS